MRLVLHFMRPYKLLAALTVILSFVDVFAALLIPTYVAHLLNQSAADVAFGDIAQTCLNMAIASLVAGVGSILGVYCATRLSAHIAKDIRDALYTKSLELSRFDFRRFGTASMVTRTLNDVVNIQVALTDFIFMMMPVPFVFVIAMTLAFRLNVTLSWWLVGVLAIVMVIAAFILTQAAPLYRRLQKLLDRIGAVLLENLTGVRVIRAFGKEDYERERMNTTFRDYANTSIKANRLFANLDGLSYLMINLFIILVFYLSGSHIAAHEFQIGDIIAMIEYGLMCLMYMMFAQMIIAMLPRALECCRRVSAVLDYTPEIRDPEPEQAVPLNQLHVPEDGEVLRFDDVRFRYPDAQEDSLTGISFTCRAGTTTAIIGSTGSGKSTLASLAMRWHDATEGEVLIDGVDVRRVSQHDLHKAIAYVQQKAWLFSGTIAENLRYRDDDANAEDLRHALDVAQASEFVSDIPEELDARVAQGGTNFSGGQRQRLSIARALVGDAQLIIFDDSFSALDFATDAKLRAALRDEMGDRAVLIIAQRVNTIAHADQIVVLDEGRIAGIGTHDELVAHCDVYRQIVESQTKQPQTIGEE